MGKVIFMKEQRVQELHGTFCGMVYRRTMKGETVVHLQRECRKERKEVVRLVAALAVNYCNKFFPRKLDLDTG